MSELLHRPRSYPMLMVAFLLSASAAAAVAIDSRLGVLTPALAVVLGALWKPQLAVMLIALALPLEWPLLQIPGKTLVVSDLTVSLAILAWILHSTHIDRFHMRIGAPVGAFAITAGASVALAADRVSTLTSVLSLWKSALCFFLAATLLRSASARRWLIVAVGCAGALATIYALAQLLHPNLLRSYQFAPGVDWSLYGVDVAGQDFQRVRSWFGDPNTFGIFEGAVTVMCAVAAMASTARWRPAFVLLAAAALAGVGLSLSRSGLLAIVGGALILAAFSANRARKRSAVFALFGVVLLIGIAVASPSGALGYRVLSIIDPSYAPNALRLGIWETSISQWLGHPVLGVGYEGFAQAAIGTIAGFGGNALIGTHSIYLEVLTGTGAVGSACFCWLVVQAFRVHRHAKAASVQLSIAPFTAAISALLVAGLFEAELNSFAMNALLFLCLGGLSAGAASSEATGQRAPRGLNRGRPYRRAHVSVGAS